MLLKLLGRYLRPHWPLLIGVVVFQLAQSLLSLWLLAIKPLQLPPKPSSPNPSLP